MNFSFRQLPFARRPATCLFAVLAVGGLTFWALLGDSGSTQASVVLVEQTTGIAREVAAAPIGAGAGSLTGQITYNGTDPKLPLKVAKGDTTVRDFAICAANDIPDQSLLINGKSSGLANVFVYLTKAPAGYKPKVPEARPKVDQKGCTFIPHTMVVHAGQTVLILNSDPILHNTNTQSPANPFNQGIKAGEAEGVPLTYKNPQRLPVNVKCDFHNWMTAYHLVQNHPFCAVTDANGEFEIKDIPAGKHNFMIWHERSGYLESNKGLAVTISAGQPTKVGLKYAPSKFTAFQGPKPKQVLVSFSE